MKGLEKVLKYAAICLICLMCLIPFYVLLVLALNSPQRVFYEGNIFIPDARFLWIKPSVKYLKKYIQENDIDTIVTSGFGGFPKGIEVGKVTNTISTGDSFMTLEVALFNNFSTLQFVYVVKDKFAEEVKALQPEVKNEQ